MPQLDAATYLGQVFWVTLSFGFYYFVALTFLVPGLAQRIKAREKKVARGQGSLTAFDDEQARALETYDGSVVAAGSWSNVHQGARAEHGDAWRATVRNSAVDGGTLSEALDALTDARYAGWGGLRATTQTAADSEASRASSRDVSALTADRGGVDLRGWSLPETGTVFWEQDNGGEEVNAADVAPWEAESDEAAIDAQWSALLDRALAQQA